jgi:hypothetical protein
MRFFGQTLLEVVWIIFLNVMLRTFPVLSAPAAFLMINYGLPTFEKVVQSEFQL